VKNFTYLNILVDVPKNLVLRILLKLTKSVKSKVIVGDAHLKTCNIHAIQKVVRQDLLFFLETRIRLLPFTTVAVVVMAI